jgi:phosphoribosylanthranilate isomerase
MRVKICGLCSAADARLAADAGADYAGVILSPVGSRRQTVEGAASIFEGAGSLVRVGVFVDADVDTILATAKILGLGVLQLHGAETGDVVDRLRAAGDWRIWKAVRLRTPLDLIEALAKWSGRADGLLLDGWSVRGHGGVGASFAWQDVAPLRDRVPAGMELIVAGGLDPDNVGLAIRTLAPDTVDVSSGVETSPGVKSADRVRAFVKVARASEGRVPVVRNGSQ